MPSTINDIVRESIARLKGEHLSLTPDNYSAMFCKIAKEKGVVTEDCQKLQKYLSRLDDGLQNDAKRYKINTIDDLLGYLCAKLNLISPTDSAKMITALSLMSKKILQGAYLLPNRKIRSLSSASLERLDSASNLHSVELISDKWNDFLTSYDDSYLRKLAQLGITNKDDIDMIANEMIALLQSQKAKDQASLKEVITLLIATLTPSIATSMSDELASISYELRSSPLTLYAQPMQQEIRKFIKKRIELDKKEIKKNIVVLDKLLDEVNSKIANFIDNNSNAEVKNIKQQLEVIDFSTDSFEAIQTKLITIASSLDVEIVGFNAKMVENQEVIVKLQETVRKLEAELLEARSESQEDFLTSVATKRALMNELELIENGYQKYDIDYSICFLDLDHFKKVNDEFGHEAGDVILKTVGKILKKECGELDVVGRYGGEEFLIVLPKKSLEEAVKFAKRACDDIEKFKFIYKNQRIMVTASLGVCERKYCQSQKEMIDIADKMLYEAKKAGRNRVVYEFS